LTRPENYVEKILAALGFLSSVIAFLSDLIVTITWLHFLVPTGLNVILVATSIVASVVLKMDVYHQIPFILGRPFLNTTKSIGKRISDSHWDIFCGSHWKPDRLICQLQMQGSRDQGIMIQLIIDYLWHDAHDCSVIRELDETSTCQSDKRWLEHLGHPSYWEDHQG
jgi:hypothetical protein